MNEAAADLPARFRRGYLAVRHRRLAHRLRDRSLHQCLCALVIGRRMVDLGIGPWGEDPTFHAPCFVVTHRPAETIVKKGGTSYIFVTEGIEGAMAWAKAAGDRDMVVQGAYTAQRALEAGVLDEPRIHQVPVLLGGGRRLFDVLPVRIELDMVRVIDTPEATHVRYRVPR